MVKDNPPWAVFLSCILRNAVAAETISFGATFGDARRS